MQAMVPPAMVLVALFVACLLALRWAIDFDPAGITGKFGAGISEAYSSHASDPCPATNADPGLPAASNSLACVPQSHP